MTGTCPCVISCAHLPEVFFQCHQCHFATLLDSQGVTGDIRGDKVTNQGVFDEKSCDFYNRSVNPQVCLSIRYWYKHFISNRTII